MGFDRILKLNMQAEDVSSPRNLIPETRQITAKTNLTPAFAFA